MTRSPSNLDVAVEPYLDGNVLERYFPPRPSVSGTACLVFGAMLAYSLYPAVQSATEMARIVAISIGIALLVSFSFDSRRGIRNLLRSDVLCLLAIYGLTLLEFLFPQVKFNEMATPEQTSTALNIVLVGISAMAIGRHLVAQRSVASPDLNFQEISNNTIFLLFLISAFLGYLAILLSVNFNLLEVGENLLKPRFAQPWSRGRLGGWDSLIYELGLLRYSLSPLAALLLNRRQSFSSLKLVLVLSITGFTWFYDFASGTRNILIIDIATFVMAYVLTLPKNTIQNTLMPIVLSIVLIFSASYHMLEFRQMGLGAYINNYADASEDSRETLAVDYNLASIGQLASAFPEQHPFLGLEVLTWALIKPVPRAFWPGKPEGLSVSIEQIMSAQGWTVASTYLGESYMMGGMVGVILISLFLGMLSTWWNRMAMQQQSDYGLVIFALGCFAALIAMRSMFWLTTAMLPVIALVSFRKMVYRR
jgi:oligosaccharide repeat unit polymerase